MKWNKILVLVAISIFACSCNNDDDGGVNEVEQRLLSEVALENDAEIVEYLKTHFYNYEEFANPPVDFDYKIQIGEITGDNANKTPLFDQVDFKTVKVSSSRFRVLEDEGDVDHKIYFLTVREGGDNSKETATAGDSAYVRYQGFKLSGEVFDESNYNIPFWFDLSNIQATGARGFTEGLTFLKPSTNVISNEDGTFTAEGFGIGMVIMPSGLGYFDTPPSGSSIGAYSPLIFKFDLITTEEQDHDNDGVASIDEDSNGDGYLLNDDADEDGTPDYLDADTN
ncbi:peptidylprolyl isomerase [uncultured Maribacter sp.]|uniref:FKBP-type peptidyl-prolyl cis-trans isomerase n=1 Tax=uncultured Maribacter sp. TaxID=431308 RepID=UPI00263723E1|nr:peptidylprolyl isomerase [uncultured Maribacter sp.]